MMIDERIAAFLNKQTVAAISLTDIDGNPYCFHCFYAYDAEKNLLYFKTSMHSHHGALLVNGKKVAGAIQPDKLNKAAIRGLQLTGQLLAPGTEKAADASKVYHKAYPFALMMPGELWTVEPQWMKFTDNTLTFGKKLVWQANEAAASLS